MAFFVPENMKRVKLYSKVRLKKGKSERSLSIVKPDEIDLSSGKISLDSPLGKALLRKKANEIVYANTPKGEVKYKIIKIA